jgi:hypothetical protein
MVGPVQILEIFSISTALAGAGQRESTKKLGISRGRLSRIA